MTKRVLFSTLRIAIAVLLVFAILWWIGMRMPGKKVMKAAALSPTEIVLRDELKADVEKLAGEIGERNMWHYAKLNAAADFIESEFLRAGLRPRRDSYTLDGRECHNIEVEIAAQQGTAASTLPIVLIGAHYDSVLGAPGANDNGTGVAGVLALARRLAGKGRLTETPYKTLRFVAFVNEEPPFFQTPQMGSYVYASRCRNHGDRIFAMISLETIGYFSDAPRSQTYPSIGLGAFYPTVGNFIGFVGNVGSRTLLRRALSIFRETKKLPAEGAALPAFIPGVAWSDQWSFWQHGYPGVMITDTAPFRYPHYHRATDTPDKLDYDRFALVVSGMEKVIVDLATNSRF
jgi:hypothetical protein